MAFIDKADYLLDTKELLRNAINKIGGNLTTTDTFRSYESQLLLDQATLKLDFETDSYGSGASSLQRNDAQSFSDVVTFTRSTTAGRFNELGLYETVAIDTPRIDHDPATVGSSTDTLTLGYGEVTINTDYEYEIGSSVVVAYDLSNYMVGKVIASSPTLVTLNVVTVVGSGTYSAWTLIVRLGLLVEESRTNLFADSFTPDSWSSSSKFTKVSGLANIDGATTAVTYTATEAVTLIKLFTLTSLSLPLTYTVVHRPEGTTNDDATLIRNATRAVNGQAGSVNFGTGVGTGVFKSTRPLANGFREVVYTFTEWPTGTQVGDQIVIYIGNVTWTAGVSRTLAFAQIEAGTFPTSYIPTAGAAVTRAADVPLRTLGSEFNPTAWTLVVEAKKNNTTSAVAGYFLLGDGTNDNRVGVTWDQSGSSGELDNIHALCVSGGAIQFSQSSGVASKDGQYHKAALSYDGSSLLFCVDGGAPIPLTGSIPAGITQLGIGLYSNAGRNVDVKVVNLFPRPFSSEELQSITS